MRFRKYLPELVAISGLLCVRANSSPPLPDSKQKLVPITIAELAKTKAEDACITEVSDYVFGGYTGDFPSPPHADLNPQRAF
ncbi:MAG TPA: hypothetical protein VFA77_14435, partial [Candidatus Eisenbacteria bacterium]|nr:hypothetical protein [Candidatus Eisenbacteria bacterium]